MDDTTRHGMSQSVGSLYHPTLLSLFTKQARSIKHSRLIFLYRYKYCAVPGMDSNLGAPIAFISFPQDLCHRPCNALKVERSRTFKRDFDEPVLLTLNSLYRLGLCGLQGAARALALCQRLGLRELQTSYIAPENPKAWRNLYIDIQGFRFPLK